MGNRAVITRGIKNEDGTWGYDPKGIGVYLHWNGGRDSVTGFLKFCEKMGFRSVNDDESYFWARFCQVIANYFGGDGLSVGIGIVDQLDCDNYDNGLYLIDEFEIVGRKFFNGYEQDGYTLESMLADIAASQPLQDDIFKAVNEDIKKAVTE